MADDNSLVPSGPRRTRRTFTKAFKARVVRMAASGERSVAQVAMEHQINANQLRRWMTLARGTSATGALVPVRVDQAHESPGRGVGIALEVAVPGMTLLFHRPVDAEAVATLLKALK